MAKLRIPHGDKEELLFYKGIYQLQSKLARRAELMGMLDALDRQIAVEVSKIRPYLGWQGIADRLGNMTAAQAQRYFEPLMPEDIEDPRAK